MEYGPPALAQIGFCEAGSGQGSAFAGAGVSIAVATNTNPKNRPDIVFLFGTTLD